MTFPATIFLRVIQLLSHPNFEVTIAVIALVILFAVATSTLLWRLRRRRQPPAEEHPELVIDIGNLSDAGPPKDSAQLEIYNLPVRLAVMVLAPVGRGGQLPPADQLPDLVDQIVPGMMSVLEGHQPEFRRWPPQLSSQGFMRSFFSHLRLPGDRGRGTVWCSIVGKFTAQETQLLAGLVCCAERPNSVTELVVERDAQWLDILRIRESAR